MSIYWSRLFPRSNSSFLLCRGNALQSSVLRLGLREEMFLLAPKICMQDELTGVPINRATRFENKVGFLNVVAGESLIKKRILERFFIDLVAGESLIKERAAARFHDFVGSLDVVAGEPLLLPRRFRQKRAWMELKKIWRTNKKVKGFIINKVKGGYKVICHRRFHYFSSICTSHNSKDSECHLLHNITIKSIKKKSYSFFVLNAMQKKLDLTGIKKFQHMSKHQ